MLVALKRKFAMSMQPDETLERDKIPLLQKKFEKAGISKAHVQSLKKIIERTIIHLSVMELVIDGDEEISLIKRAKRALQEFQRPPYALKSLLDKWEDHAV